MKLSCWPGRNIGRTTQKESCRHCRQLSSNRTLVKPVVVTD